MGQTLTLYRFTTLILARPSQRRRSKVATHRKCRRLCGACPAINRNGNALACQDDKPTPDMSLLDVDEEESGQLNISDAIQGVFGVGISVNRQRGFDGRKGYLISHVQHLYQVM